MKVDTVFDIGANVGNFTALMLSLGAKKIVTVEPTSFLVDSLRQRFVGRPEVVIVPKAVSDHIGTVEFYISEAHTISTASKDWVTQSRFTNEHTWYAPVTVDCVTIDSLIETYGVPEFLKIDVEGYELTALKGLTKFIKSIIAFEWAEEKKSEIEQSLKYLHDLGYNKFSHVTGTDSLEHAPKDFLQYDSFLKKFLSEMDPERKSAWGMIYVLPE
jgi:FkbM family methyltransferase